MIHPTEQAYNNHCLSFFNSILYQDVLTEDHIQGSEIAVEVDGEQVTGYCLKKELRTYFIPTSGLEKLPIRVRKTEMVIDNRKVYHVIQECATIRNAEKDCMSFKALIDGFCNFRHTNPLHFTLWKIMVITAYVSRINFRLATLASFGKDSVVDALRDITNNCARVDKATFAKLEYILKFPFILCNEVASLTASEKREFESFGLSAGAFQNKYTKRSRKGEGTKEIYDISRLSLGFTFNIARYYREKGRPSFDDVFPEQFLDRFTPFKMDGVIDVMQFRKNGDMDFEAECRHNMEHYRQVLEKLAYLINHPVIPRYNSKWQFASGRHEKSFSTICTHISHYAESYSEYLEMCAELYKCHKKYVDEEGALDEIQTKIAEEEIIKG